MTSDRKIQCLAAGIVSVLIVFYGYYRVRNEPIHRKTWNAGWNRHWIEALLPHPIFDVSELVSDADFDHDKILIARRGRHDPLASLI